MEKENIKIEQKVIVKKEKVSVFNKILSLVLLALASVLALGTILCAVLPKNYNINLAEPTRIVVHSSTNADVNKSVYEKGSSNGVYEKIIKLYNNSFNTTALNAMFQGKLFDSVAVAEGYKSISSLNGTYIEFLYDETQQVKLNGQVYDANIVSDVNYRSVVIEIKDTDNLTQINAYVRYKDTLENEYSYVRFVSYAIQGELFNYIESL